jgi:hypothetical protein
MRALELVTAAAVHAGLQAAAILSAVWMPRLVEKSAEMGLKDEGVKDREFMFRATGFLPAPKASQTIVVQQNATATAPAIVPLSSPESSIAMLAEAFNKARQTLPPSPVRNTVNLTAHRDETHDNEDES